MKNILIIKVAEVLPIKSIVSESKVRLDTHVLHVTVHYSVPWYMPLFIAVRMVNEAANASLNDAYFNIYPNDDREVVLCVTKCTYEKEQDYGTGCTV